VSGHVSISTLDSWLPFPSLLSLLLL
jgi:hypothetical protein